MEIDELAAAFPPAHGYLNTASLGLPALAGLAAIEQHLAEWRAGRSEPPEFDAHVDRSRAAYARLASTTPARVAIVGSVSVATGLVASSLPDGATVLCAEEDFTSVLFPFLADRRLDTRPVPLDQLLDAVSPQIDLVAVSAVQSADGRRLDLDALADVAAGAGARTFLDVTQAAGWMPLPTDRFDITACGAYKWLCCPRGAGFMTLTPAAADWVAPRHANWYAGEEPWQSIYGPPLRLASEARRYDASPGWISWVGAAPALEALADTGVAAIEAHDVGLTNRLRERLGMPPSDSAIVSLDRPGAAEALAAADIRSAGRAGRIRLAFHCYNTADDVDLVVTALGVD